MYIYYKFYKYVRGTFLRHTTLSKFYEVFLLDNVASMQYINLKNKFANILIVCLKC